ncbi:hypothetical protein DERA104750_12370 [Deinococcus radiodurans]
MPAVPPALKMLAHRPRLSAGLFCATYAEPAGWKKPEPKPATATSRISAPNQGTKPISVRPTPVISGPSAAA